MKDYTSREAVLDRIIGYDFQHCPDYMEDQATELKHAVICDLKDAVETLPAADVAPVVHAKWIKNDNGTWSCGRCYSWIPNEQHYYARYCLYCGAKMDGGKKNVG